jgi:hypothetical protein
VVKLVMKMRVKEEDGKERIGKRGVMFLRSRENLVSSGGRGSSRRIGMVEKGI